jgi:hypothetical protein
MIRKAFKHLVSWLVFSSIVLSSTAAFSQKIPQPTGTSGTWRQAKPVCQGGWSGYVSFSKVLQDSLKSDEPGIRKAKDRIIHETSRDYQYIARAIVNGDDPKEPIVTTHVNFVDKASNWGMEKVFDTCNSTEAGHWFIIEGDDRRLTEGRLKAPARSFNLSVDELAGTYGFSLLFPSATGRFVREEHVKRSGHCQAKNNEPWDRLTDEPVKIDGESVSIHGEKIDQNNPEFLSGSKTWTSSTPGVKSFTYTVNWRFKRCVENLLITEYKLEHPKFPKFDDWQQIVPEVGTIDGNRVKIKAKVANLSAEDKYAVLSFKETYKGDRWNGASPDELLPDAEIGVRFEAGEEREFELDWDTDGQSWFDDGRPHLLHRIKAEVKEEGKLKDTRTESIKIAPKPLVLAHGIFGTWNAFEMWQNLLTLTHSYDWKAYAVGEKAEQGIMDFGKKTLPMKESKSIAQNARELAKYVNYARENSNAWHVDIVGHSLGGLASRFYINSYMPDSPDGKPVAKHLVMLGTPNGGSPCAGVMDTVWDLVGETPLMLREIAPDKMQLFNSVVRDRKRVKFSALAGNPLPVMCGKLGWNDGMSSVESATLGVEDKATSRDIHKNLVSGRNFNNFVKPHLISGPKKTYPIPVVPGPEGIDKYKVSSLYNNGREYAKLLFASASYGESEINAIKKEGKIAGGATVEIDIPVTAAQNFGLTFMADASVSAYLVNERRVVVDKDEAGTETAEGEFRLLYYPNSVAAGTWKIRLKNTSSVEQIFAAVGWSIGSPLPSSPVAE